MEWLWHKNLEMDEQQDNKLESNLLLNILVDLDIRMKQAFPNMRCWKAFAGIVFLFWFKHIYAFNDDQL